LVEYVVHHEDVRRATGQPANRDLPQPMQEELWRQLRTFARLTQARAETGVVLVVPGGPRAVVRRGRRSIAVSGMPVELALYLTGRTAHADVQVIATKPRPRALHRR
ncbi:MAG TPA: TIGR03085 family protein, partial [Beutenbergiaceae bacterium]|nr:TIGR03085 family protein [Beutenbergiaceae bacterium]